jgi:hypothetical protein
MGQTSWLSTQTKYSLSCILKTRSAFLIIESRMVEWLLNNELERIWKERVWPQRISIPLLPWKEWENQQRLSVRTAGTLTEIQTGYFPNWSSDCYRYNIQLSKALPWSPASYSGSTGSSLGQVIWDLLWTKWHCGRFSPSTLFPLPNFIPPIAPHSYISSGTSTIGRRVVAVPSGLSLTPWENMKMALPYPVWLQTVGLGEDTSECWCRCAATEGQRDDKEDVACTVYQVLCHLSAVSEVCHRHSLVKRNIPTTCLWCFLLFPF